MNDKRIELYEDRTGKIHIKIKFTLKELISLLGGIDC